MNPEAAAGPGVRVPPPMLYLAALAIGIALEYLRWPIPVFGARHVGHSQGGTTPCRQIWGEVSTLKGNCSPMAVSVCSTNYPVNADAVPAARKTAVSANCTGEPIPCPDCHLAGALGRLEPIGQEDGGDTVVRCALRRSDRASDSAKSLGGARIAAIGTGISAGI